MHLSYASRQQLFFQMVAVARAADLASMRQHGTTCTTVVQGIKSSPIRNQSKQVKNNLCI